MTAAEQKPSPSLLRRLVAMVYDALLVIALVFVVNGMALAIASQALEKEVLDPVTVQALTAVSVAGFFCLFWITNGQTLGMQAWRIKLVDFEGNKPGVLQSLLRCMGAALSAGCLGIGYLWCIVDRNKRYWHDYISRTELILLPKKGKLKQE